MPGLGGCAAARQSRPKALIALISATKHYPPEAEKELEAANAELKAVLKKLGLHAHPLTQGHPLWVPPMGGRSPKNRAGTGPCSYVGAKMGGHKARPYIMGKSLAANCRNLTCLSGSHASFAFTREGRGYTGLKLPRDLSRPELASLLRCY